jgi:membrane fusion protein (multidrug efflux system)
VSAVRKGPGGDHVFVISADEKGNTRAHLRPVQAGDVVGDSILILGGLAAGDQVASSGAFKLREGALVVLAKDQAQANGSR